MDKLLILFTMKGCPYCVELKEMIIESDIDFIERDIDKHKDEYDLFAEITENEYVPAFMIVDNPHKNMSPRYFAPERDFNEIVEGFNIIKENFR